MSKKSKMKKKKHVVIVKRKSNNSTAKNTNNIVIRIDNRKKAGKRKTMSMTSSTKTEPRKQEPTVVPVIRQYTDIGDYTQEIVKRNDAIREEQRIKALENLQSKAPSRLPTAKVEPIVTAKVAPIITSVLKTPSPLPKRKIDLLKPLSTYRLESMDTFDKFLKSREKLGSATTDEPSSSSMRALDLSTPLEQRNLRNDVKRSKPQYKTLNTIFGLFEADFEDMGKSITSYNDFNSWVAGNLGKKVGQTKLQNYSFSGSQEHFNSRFNL